MALTLGGRAPYAPAPTLKKVIDRHRQVGLPRIDIDTLLRIGVTDALAPRTLAAVKLLDFYDEKGVITPEFDALSRVPEADFPERLGELLRRAYAPVIEIIGEPSDAKPQEIEDAFRGFEPRGQLPRIVQCFIGLMTIAGLMSETSKRKPGPRPERTIRVSKATAAKVRASKKDSEAPVDPPADVPPTDPQPVDLTSMRRAYFDLLIKKAAEADATDTDLLDRIERLVGLHAEGVATT